MRIHIFLNAQIGIKSILMKDTCEEIIFCIAKKCSTNSHLIRSVLNLAYIQRIACECIQSLNCRHLEATEGILWNENAILQLPHSTYL